MLFKAQDFYWPKIYFTKIKKRAFSSFFLKKAVFRCSFWFLAVFVFVTIVLVCFSSAERVYSACMSSCLLLSCDLLRNDVL